jgi:hypothetical protein
MILRVLQTRHVLGIQVAFSRRTNVSALTYLQGDLVLDEAASVWDDWWPGDEERDIEENRREFPQGFRWLCCTVTGDKACSSAR